MVCMNCNSNNVLVQQIEIGSKTATHKSNVVDGGLRLTGALMTGGLSLLLPKKKLTAKQECSIKKLQFVKIVAKTGKYKK